MSSEYVEFVLKSFKDGDFTATQYEILKEITIDDIVSSLAEDTDSKEVFWNYVYILGALALVYQEGLPEDSDKDVVGILAQTVLDVLTKKQKGQDASDDIAAVLNDDIQNFLIKIKDVKLDQPEEKPATSNDNPFMNMFQGMEGSKICDLAKEISNDIDVGNLKIDSSDDIMKLLDFSSSNNVMGDIIKKVSSKMHEKISSGDLKQEDLFGEAMSMMGKMNLGGGGGGGGLGGLGGLASLFNNPMMSEMMKMAKKGKAKTNPEAFKGASSRDRLRRKLDERKKPHSSLENVD